jgi:phosphate transport system permease protein
MKTSIKSIWNWTLLGGSTLLVCLFLGLILLDIFSKGSQALSLTFISRFPSKGMTEGGILPAILGTVLLTVITACFSVPFGVACAVYLNEYAPANVLTSLIRAAIRNLAGIPSIIYGLFGLALFVQAMHLGTSALAAGLTLGLLSLPYVITTTEESLKRVPDSLREATMGLGATQFETIRDVVLPQAFPGILTGVILAISRAAGETAPILFTGAVFYINGLTTSVNQEFMALPYHLYMLSTQHHAIEQVRPLAYGTACVLVMLVFIMNSIAFYLRIKTGNRPSS